MTTAALALALGAAVLHATWNLILARADDPRAATAAALAVALVAFAPAAALAGSVTPQAWRYIVPSAALEAAYYLLLSAAYRRGALSAVYPVARGAAPVLILVAGIAGVGGAASAPQVVGVLVVGAGIVAVQRGGEAATTRALLLALATAATIAAYTVVDREGLRHADPLPYLWLVLTPSALLTIAMTANSSGPRAVRAALNPATVVAGLATFGAYALVLAALQRAPAAPVAAVRETSIVLAVAAGALILREPVAPLRWAGAVAVTAGVAVVALG
ncbi:MAG TPA: EamA family transporter [Baekduia sp.]|nr:EamA family transporter [Baekduia sp.]